MVSRVKQLTFWGLYIFWYQYTLDVTFNNSHPYPFNNTDATQTIFVVDYRDANGIGSHKHLSFPSLLPSFSFSFSECPLNFTNIDIPVFYMFQNPNKGTYPLYRKDRRTFSPQIPISKSGCGDLSILAYVCFF